MIQRTDGPSAAVRIRVMKRDKFQCTYCGTPGTNAELEVDHIIAVAKGGSHHMSNLTTACRACNQEKSDGTMPLKANSQVPQTNGIVGLFLHILDTEGVIHYQGHIIGLQDDLALVQLFSFFDGRPTNVIAIAKTDILDASKTKLYATNEIMNDEYDIAYQRDKAKREQAIYLKRA